MDSVALLAPQRLLIVPLEIIYSVDFVHFVF